MLVVLSFCYTTPKYIVGNIYEFKEKVYDIKEVFEHLDTGEIVSVVEPIGETAGETFKYKVVRNLSLSDFKSWKFLVENGADIKSENNLALTAACADGRLKVVKYLIERGADIHRDDDIALCLAAENGQLDVVKYLVEQGANIRAYNNYPLVNAKRNNWNKVVEYLESLN